MQVIRVIKIRLLCVQEDPIHRALMSQVVLMLSSNMKLPHPNKPGIFMERRFPKMDDLSSNHNFSSGNQLTTTHEIEKLSSVEDHIMYQPIYYDS